MSLLRSLIRHDDGQALPEFALVVPLLLLILIAVLHFGKAVNYWNDATHVSAEGARYAAVDGKPFINGAGTLQEQLLAQGDTAELRGGGTDAVPAGAQVCINFPDNNTALPGYPVRVTMKFTYSWLPLFGLADTVVESTSVMRLERVPTKYTAGCT